MLCHLVSRCSTELGSKNGSKLCSPLAASRRPGLVSNKMPALSCATTTASNSLTFISKVNLAGARRVSCSAKLSRGGRRLCRMYELRGRVSQDRAQRSRGRIAGRILPVSDRPATVMQFAKRNPSATDSALCSIYSLLPRFLEYHHLNEPAFARLY